VLDPLIVVGTLMTNFGLERSLPTLGVKRLRTPVGDRHVVRVMQETGASIGGETSGHIILAELSTTGDGALAALRVAALLARSGAPLSRLADLRKAPQVLRNSRFAACPGRGRAPGGRRLAAAEEALAGIDACCCVLRTEPLLG
jgi:phosphoglucosamine mutase